MTGGLQEGVAGMGADHEAERESPAFLQGGSLRLGRQAGCSSAGLAAGTRSEDRAPGGRRGAAGALLPLPTSPPPLARRRGGRGAQAGGGGGGSGARGYGDCCDEGRWRGRAGGRGHGPGEGQPPGALRCRRPRLHHERRAAGDGRRRQREWRPRGKGPGLGGGTGAGGVGKGRRLAEKGL